MAVRTGKEFLEGLRDGREVWLEGERVGRLLAEPRADLRRNVTSPV